MSPGDVASFRPTLGFRFGLRFPAVLAFGLRLALLVPARWWPDRNVMLMRGFQPGSYAGRLARDDALWAAYTGGGAPAYAPEFAYEDDFLPDHIGETYRGLDGLRRAWTGFTEPFETMAYQLERVVGSGDRVVSVHRVRAKARHTGITQDFRVAYSWTFRRGRISHCRAFFDPEQALEDAGLTE